MPTILSGSFFLIINCLFTCFDIISALSVKSGCHIMSARGTRNFVIILISSGNRHIFTSMFKCASLVHPCTSVACCQTKFQVPLTALKRHPYFDEPCCYSDKHWKDGFNNNKQKMHFRIVVFCIEREISLWIGVILLQEILSPFRKHLCNQW